MDKMEIYHYLSERNIAYETMEHKAVYNMEELAAVELPHSECYAKNLFVRDDKKRKYYLITVMGKKRVDLKEFRRQHGLRALSFASEEELRTILGLTPGSVSPFGILNNIGGVVHFYLDESFRDGNIAVHPNDNTATVWLSANSLMKLIKEHGNIAEFAKI